MNSLSWFIYFAGAFGNLNMLLGAFLFFGTFITIILTVCGMLVHCTEYKPEEKTVKFWEEKRKMCATMASRLWFLIVVAALAQIFTPSRDTMMAIAASQVAEKVAQNETVKGIADDATKALQQWIKKQIEPEKKKE